MFVCRYVAPSGECYYNTLSCCDYFSSSSVVSSAFSALCMYSKFRHHPDPLGYLCAKFSFSHSLHCWASHGENHSLTHSNNHSFTHSVTHPAYFMCLKPQALQKTCVLSINLNSSYKGHWKVLSITAQQRFKIVDVNTSLTNYSNICKAINTKLTASSISYVRRDRKIRQDWIISLTLLKVTGQWQLLLSTVVYSA